jgi:hypothetical protein
MAELPRFQSPADAAYVPPKLSELTPRQLRADRARAQFDRDRFAERVRYDQEQETRYQEQMDKIENELRSRGEWW